MSLQCQSSGLKSADAAILAVPGKVVGIQLIPDGTNACSLIIYDHASSASGTVVLKVALPASSTQDNTVMLNHPILCHSGIYADVTGTGANYIVHYSVGD